LQAIRADKKLADLLRMKVGDPVLHIERKLSTNRKDFNIYSNIYYNSEEHPLSEKF